MSTRPTPEILSLCQSKEMLVSLGWDLFPGVYYILQENKYENKANRDDQKVAWNRDDQKVAWTEVSKRHPTFSRLCKLLSTIHSRLQ